MEAEYTKLFVQETYSLKSKTWNDVEEDDPSPDEIAAFEEFRASNVAQK